MLGRLCFKQGKETAAFVFCDLVGIPFAVTAPARKKASEATGIPVEHIAVTGHAYAHRAAVLHVDQRLLARSGRRQARQGSVRQRRTIAHVLIDKIASAIVQAKAALAPVELKAGFAREDRISFNRRYHMKGGAVRFNPAVNESGYHRTGRADRSAGWDHLAFQSRVRRNRRR